LGRTESHISHLEFFVIFLKFSNVHISQFHGPKLKILDDAVVATAEFESDRLDGLDSVDEVLCFAGIFLQLEARGGLDDGLPRV
jgi:hypothetical protein